MSALPEHMAQGKLNVVEDALSRTITGSRGLFCDQDPSSTYDYSLLVITAKK
jgi:hypothetical protein